MPLRTITAPGVEIKEIDKSNYSKSMTGSACFVPLFSSKGEPYKYKAITSRTAFETLYGTPDNEAERYGYAAVTEALNQNGNLYVARLPYDNASFEKMVGVKYRISTKQNYDELSSTGIYHAINDVDPEIKNAVLVEGGSTPILYDLSAIDEYRTDEARVPANSFLIVDTTGATYKRVIEDTRKGQKREVIGIVPVVTTAANAMLAQRLIQVELSSVKDYEALGGSKFNTLNTTIDGNVLSNDGLSSVDMVDLINTAKYFREVSSYEGTILSAVSCLEDEFESEELAEQYILSNNLNGYSVSACVGDELSDSHYVVVSAMTVSAELSLDPTDPRYGWHGEFGDTIPDTMSINAAEYFSTIQPATDGEGGFDSEHLKDVGVVVYKMYLDPSEGSKVSYEAVEAYCGSLYKDDKDPTTGVTKFLDTIINTQSNYINFFSNCFVSKTSKEFYTKSCDIMIASPTTGAALGLYSEMTQEDISISRSILDGLNKAFDKAKDINEFDIDIVCDAGVSNIASYLKAIFGDKGPYDLTITDDLGNSLLGMWKCQSPIDKSVKMWKTVVDKFDNFCKNTRKDCMFITECPRPLVLNGQKKIIRDTKPSNTIDGMIIPYLPAIAGLNTSYGAGYLDWFEQADDYTGDFFWCPPSIKAMGVYINTDVNFNYWDAPAGLNRGIIAATDVAFSPTGKQAGLIYDKCWNYAINYPTDGIVLEGQKTLQVRPTALDRINVRRLMLRLERAAHKVLRYYVYEPHTQYTRQRIVDALDPYFRNCKNAGGLYDYLIKCDESNNPAEVIDNNELVIQIGVKPTKTIEYIMCSFTIGSAGAKWEELGLK